MSDEQAQFPFTDTTTALAGALLAWYDLAVLEMPWRGSRDPYRIWLSEVMLQQTRIAAAEPYYTRFLARFPSLAALAAAPLDEVLKCWEGLGYYARARNLHRLAQVLVAEHDSEFPTSAAELQQLPGIGRYTAAAIASIAFGQPVAVLDGNVMRVLARLTDLPDDISETATQAKLWRWAEALLPTERPGDFNQAVMDLGRLVCVPRRPRCQECPWQTHCLALAHQTTTQRPVKKAKAPLPQMTAAVAVIRDHQGRLLLVRRPPEGLLGGLWTLPGGQCNAEESLPDCLRRSVAHQLQIEIEVGAQMAVATQQFTHFQLTLRAFSCQVASGTPQTANSADLAWAALSELDRYSLGKADREVVASLNQWQPRLFEEFD